LEKGPTNFPINCLLLPDHLTVKPINNIIKKRRRLTSQENIILNQVFEKFPRPSKEVKELIAKKLGMSMRCIQIWFQNRRAKAKKDLQFDSDDQLLSYISQQSGENEDGKVNGCGMFGEFLIAPNSDLLSSISNVVPSSPVYHEAKTLNNNAKNVYDTPAINLPGENDNFNTDNSRSTISLSSIPSSSTNLDSEISLFSPGLDSFEYRNCMDIPTKLLPDYFTLRTIDSEQSENLFWSESGNLELGTSGKNIGGISLMEGENSGMNNFNFEDYLNL
jgi:hypothetical protein